MVPLSKSGVRKHRGFESRPLRHTLDHTDRSVSPAGPDVSGERSPSGLWRRTGNAVRGNPSRVRIPPSPPHRVARGRPMPALTPAVLAHAPQGALAPVLGRRLGLDRPLAPLRHMPGRRAVERVARGRPMRPLVEHAAFRVTEEAWLSGAQRSNGDSERSGRRRKPFFGVGWNAGGSKRGSTAARTRGPAHD